MQELLVRTPLKEQLELFGAIASRKRSVWPSVKYVGIKKKEKKKKRKTSGPHLRWNYLDPLMNIMQRTYINFIVGSDLVRNSKRLSHHLRQSLSAYLVTYTIWRYIYQNNMGPEEQFVQSAT